MVRLALPGAFETDSRERLVCKTGQEARYALVHASSCSCARSFPDVSARLHVGYRTSAAQTDFSDILPEELAKDVKDAAQISMGTEISQEDIDNIMDLCDQVISISEYREQLSEYLKNRYSHSPPS